MGTEEGKKFKEMDLGEKLDKLWAAFEKAESREEKDKIYNEFYYLCEEHFKEEEDGVVFRTDSPMRDPNFSLVNDCKLYYED